MRIANREYTYPVSKLYAAITANRKRHVELFEAASAIYRRDAIEYLEDSVTLALEGKEIRRTIDLIKPVSHVKDYDQIIAMLEMTSETVIKINSDEFAMFVMDDWDWSAQFSLTNKSYGVGG